MDGGCVQSNEYCPECYESQKDVVVWKTLEVNPAIKAYRDSYISPVKGWHPSLTHALAAWGIVVTPEEE